MSDVPAALMIVISTTPGAPAGLIAVTVPLEFRVKELAATVPNWTPVVPARCVPVMITAVPPVIMPEETLRPVTAGGGVT